MRLYSLGELDWKDTQLYYHAMAHLGMEGVIICIPRTPYFCVGYHQDVRQELDIGYLDKMGMPLEEAAIVAGAIGNHDESNGEPVSAPCAALIIADKTDVLRERVRNPVMVKFDIHDRVNYAAQSADVTVDKERRLITLHLTIDTSISTVMEYFEIFLSRTRITRRAANYLNCDFNLVINEVELT